MKPWERRSFNTLNVIIALTGIVYFYMKYLIVIDDPFAVINHAWQPSMLSLHVITAPILLIFFGMGFRSHTYKKILSNQKPDRRTGWTSLISFSSMALTGYLLQVLSSPVWLQWMVVLHIATSVIFLIGYSAHLILGWRFIKASRTLSAQASSKSVTVQQPS